MNCIKLNNVSGSLGTIHNFHCIIWEGRVSTKIRPEDEMVLLMKTARNRFKKALESGQIEIINEREWKLR